MNVAIVGFLGLVTVMLVLLVIADGKARHARMQAQARRAMLRASTRQRHAPPAPLDLYDREAS